MKILITGGASGLGKGIVEKIAPDKNKYILFTFCSSRSSAKALVKKFPNTKAIHANFLKQTSINKLLLTIDKEKPDVLINNAITNKLTLEHFHKINPNRFIDDFHHNLIPVILITQQFIRTRRLLKSGKIITILTQVLVNDPPLGLSEYTASKSYLHSLCKSWTVEYQKFNITSDCIFPSFLQTNFTSNIDRRLIHTIISKIKKNNISSIEKVGNIIVHQLDGPFR